MRPNSAGQARFVDPDLASGTLRMGYEMYRSLEYPFARVMSYAQDFVSRIDFSVRERANSILRACNAFADPADTVRLRLPQE